eukprot:CFRG7304T1
MARDESRPATNELNTRQKVYLIILQGLFTAIVVGAVTAAIHYLVWREETSLSAWQWDPLPLAGDAALSIGIQQGITALLSGPVCRYQIRKGMVAPLILDSKSKMNSPNGIYWFTVEDHSIWKGRRVERQRFKNTLRRGAVFVCLSLLFLWPPFAGILSVVLATYGRMLVWQSILFFGVMQALIGFLTTPIVAYIALISAGREEISIITPYVTTGGKLDRSIETSKDITNELNEECHHVLHEEQGSTAHIDTY